MQKFIVHVDMDAYFASVEQADNPALRGKPVIVCGNPESRTVVSAASYEAKRHGVKAGMSIPEALSLCPHACLVPGNHSRYAELSQKIFSAMRGITENIEISSIDEAFADVTHLLNLYKNCGNICTAVKKTIKGLTGLPCSCGAGPNKLIAKIASSLAKPDGIKSINESAVEQFMETLPVECVPGIGPKTAERLHDIGITLCGQVKKTGKAFFAARFGTAGAKIHDAACGIDNNPVITAPPAPLSIGHSQTMAFDTNDRKTISAVLSVLCEKTAARMRHENRHGMHCTITLKFHDFSSLSRRQRFRDIPPEGKRIYLLAMEILDRVKITKPVRMAGISIGGLFQNEYAYLFPEKREEAFRIADTINERFGNNIVVPASWLVAKRNKG